MLTHKGTQRLETERLFLRRFTSEDAQAMYDNWASDPEVTKYLTWPTHSNPEISARVLKDWVDGYEKEDSYLWAIVLKENGNAPIGSISADPRNDKAETVHIGYCIGKRWWHRGIMPEALKVVIDFLFDEVGVQRIDARHDATIPIPGRSCESAV